ncbi:MAG: Maf family protein [Promethearchaeota archaeon]
MNNRTIKKLYLASASPRRANLLSQYGFIFEILTPEAEEILNPNPLTHTIKNAQLKAQSVLNKVSVHATILGVDTVVVADKKIYGKPRTPKENASMLQVLIGKKHKVITALALISHNHLIFRTLSESTTVFMRAVSQKELQAYVQTREGIDKAGGYGIQGKGAFLIDRIEGCYNNVIGLPMTRLLTLLHDIPEIDIGSIVPWLLQ